MFFSVSNFPSFIKKTEDLFVEWWKFFDYGKITTLVLKRLSLNLTAKTKTTRLLQLYFHSLGNSWKSDLF